MCQKQKAGLGEVDGCLRKLINLLQFGLTLTLPVISGTKWNDGSVIILIYSNLFMPGLSITVCLSVLRM